MIQPIPGTRITDTPPMPRRVGTADAPADLRRQKQMFLHRPEKKSGEGEAPA